MTTLLVQFKLHWSCNFLYTYVPCFENIVKNYVSVTIYSQEIPLPVHIVQNEVSLMHILTGYHLQYSDMSPLTTSNYCGK